MLYITLPRADLLKAVQNVVQAADRRSNGSTYACILLEADGSDLTLTAVSHDLELVCRIHAATRYPGTICVNARKLFDILRSLDRVGDIELSASQAKQLHIKYGRSRFTLSLLDPADFPRTEGPVLTTQVRISRDAFRAAIEGTAFAASATDVRVYLQGLLLDLDGKTVTWTASNGHRLATTRATTGEEHTPLQVILPRFAVGEVLRVLGQPGDEEVLVQLGANRLQIARGDTRLTVRLLDAKYPNYRGIIPSHANKVTANRLQLFEALQRAAILTDEQFRSATVQVKPDSIVIVAHNPDGDEAIEVVEASAHGSELKAKVNVDYLVDAVKAIEGELACIEYGAGDAALLVHGSGPQQHVVMPLRA